MFALVIDQGQIISFVSYSGLIHTATFGASQLIHYLVTKVNQDPLNTNLVFKVQDSGQFEEAYWDHYH